MIKAKNIITGKEINVKIINPTYNKNLVEVKIIEGKFKGKYAIVDKKDLITTTSVNNKTRAKMEISKFNNEFDRALCLTIYSENEKILDKIIDIFENRLNIEFTMCLFEYENLIGDTCYIDFEYGEMTEIKKNIKDLWKEIKKELNLK